MHQGDSREQSTAILRVALGFMGQHPAGFTPYHYAVWYEHCAGRNPGLSQALESLLSAKRSITDDIAWTLHAEHILLRDAQQYSGLRDSLLRILQETAGHTEAAGKEVSAFGATLGDRTRHLAMVRTVEAVRATVEDMQSDTAKVRAITSELVVRLEASAQAVISLDEKLKQAQYEALFDQLTGLRNRRGFETAVRECQTAAAGLAGAALMMVDVDDFKGVNDTYGHVLGDKVLHAVAHVIRTNVKGRDVPARLGGDEFAVLLPETTLDHAMTLASNIRALIARGRIKRSERMSTSPQQQPETIGQVTVSIGVALAETHESLESLLERADRALYRAKCTGRNRVEGAGPAPT